MTDWINWVKKPLDEDEIYNEEKDNLIYLDKLNPPMFINMILDNNHIYNKAKKHFICKFLKVFANKENINFRRSNIIYFFE